MVECYRKEDQPEVEDEPNASELHIDGYLSKEGSKVKLIVVGSKDQKFIQECSKVWIFSLKQ